MITSYHDPATLSRRFFLRLRLDSGAGEAHNDAMLNLLIALLSMLFPGASDAEAPAAYDYRDGAWYALEAMPMPAEGCPTEDSCQVIDGEIVAIIP